MQKYPPINPKCAHMLHGGDYNPDQWLQLPEIINEDFRLMKLAGCNAMSVGIFSWVALEPREGEYTFGWLDDIMDRLAAQGDFAVLATPSGARPAWLSQRYPEVLRVGANRVRNLHGGRHNHCYTSPVYREKTAAINCKLAERYADHPALLVWHLSNEYGGECFCPLCEEAFRGWLRERYHDDLDALNRAWYTGFWSHTYTDWSQIEAPAPHGEGFNALHLEWWRFVTYQTTDFMRHEITALRAFSEAPTTTNMMGTYGGLDYWKMAPALDVISWDSYPRWHCSDDVETASYVAFVHNLNRSLKGGRPYMLMESTPSVTNWQEFGKLKRPGMHLLTSLQAVAHGSDTVQYFQWRKSRGSSEKFHGAVVDHVGHEHTRVFNDVADVGRALAKLDPVVGATTPAQVAVIFDWENRWALDTAPGPRRTDQKQYESTCHQHSKPCWQAGIPFDVIDEEQDFAKYTLLIAPMLYMIKPGVAERITAFVEAGGTFVTTYWSGISDETDLCFLGGFPGPLRPLLGIWAEEIDAPAMTERNSLVAGDNALGMTGPYPAHTLLDLIHAEGATVLATYGEDFYAGRPALTVHQYGKGQAYYIAARTDSDFLTDFYGGLAAQLGLARALDSELPTGVVAHLRTDGERKFVFVMNFTPDAQQVTLPAGASYTELLTDGQVCGELALAGYGVAVLAS